MQNPNSGRLALALSLALGLLAGVVVARGADGSTEVATGGPPALAAAAVAPEQLEGGAERTYEEAEAKEPHKGARAEPRRVKAPGGVRIPESVTLAAPEQAGCQTRLVRNYSSRNGRSPRLFVLHYTVSGNRPGWSDMDGVTGWFNNPASQASSHYLIDHEGHCRLLVPESGKAWTQGSFNPVSLSVEVINTGRESSYAGSAGLEKLARVVAAATKRWKIPLQKGATSGCSVTRAGVVDHDSLGCGNNHTDIRPFSTDAVVAAAKRVSGTAAGVERGCLTAVSYKIVRYARNPKGSGHSQRYWKRRARGQADLIRRLARRRNPAAWGANQRGCRYQRLARAAR